MEKHRFLENFKKGMCNGKTLLSLQLSSYVI